MPSTNELMHRLRDEKPECPVCHKPCDPDKVPPGVDLIMIPHDPLGDTISFLPVHQGACRREAEERLLAGQRAVRERLERQDRAAALKAAHADGTLEGTVDLSGQPTIEALPDTPK